MPLRESMSFSLVAHKLVDGTGFVMHPKAVDDCRAGFIKTEHFNLSAFAAELDYDLIQRCDGGDVPEMRLRQIDGDLVERFLEVKNAGELICRAEKYLSTT